MIATLLIAALLQAPQAARIGSIDGRVDLIRPAGTAVAQVGDEVSAGDRLHTWNGSTLAISTESGVTLQLRSEATLEMKKVDGEPLALLVEGSVNVKSSGKPARIETKYGQIIGTEDTREFDVSYSGDVIHVFVILGSVRAEASDPSKILFKNAYDFGARVYEAGNISPTVPRPPSETTVIVYPRVNPIPKGPRTRPRMPPFPPK